MFNECYVQIDSRGVGGEGSRDEIAKLRGHFKNDRKEIFSYHYLLSENIPIAHIYQPWPGPPRPLQGPRQRDERTQIHPPSPLDRSRFGSKLTRPSVLRFLTKESSKFLFRLFPAPGLPAAWPPYPCTWVAPGRIQRPDLRIFELKAAWLQWTSSTSTSSRLIWIGMGGLAAPRRLRFFNDPIYRSKYWLRLDFHTLVF